MAESAEVLRAEATSSENTSPTPPATPVSIDTLTDSVVVVGLLSTVVVIDSRLR